MKRSDWHVFCLSVVFRISTSFYTSVAFFNNKGYLMGNICFAFQV